MSKVKPGSLINVRRRALKQRARQIRYVAVTTTILLLVALTIVIL